MLDIKGHRLAEARDLVLESGHRGLQESLQQIIIEAMQLLAQPGGRGNGLLDIKAIGLGWVQVQAKAQFDDQQGMLHEEAPQLAGVAHAFADAQQKGFEVGALGVSGSPA